MTLIIMILTMWAGAGIIFWGMYETVDFMKYPFSTIALFFLSIVLGPFCWLALVLKN